MSSISYISGDPLLWGTGSTNVRAPITEILAFFWDTKGRNQAKADTLVKEYIEEKNHHNRVEYVVKKGIKAFSNREFSNRVVWKRENDSKMIIVSQPATDEVIDTTTTPNDTVKGEIKCCFVLASISKSETSVNLLVHVDFGGFTPKVFQEYFAISNLKRITDCQQYFQRLRKLSDLDEKDGVEMGDVVTLKSKAEEIHVATKGRTKHEVS